MPPDAGILLTHVKPGAGHFRLTPWASAPIFLGRGEIRHKANFLWLCRLRFPFRRSILKATAGSLSRAFVMFAVADALLFPVLGAQNSTFHNAPATAKKIKNPNPGQN